jgi:hypothetical protein
MRTVLSRLAVVAGLAAVLLAASPASAQVKKADLPGGGSADAPAVHRMEIYNGPLRTVARFGTNLSPSDQATLRELDLAENEVTVSDHLLALRAQYIVDEQALEPYRRSMQMLLYGYNAEINSSAYAYAGGGPPYGYLGPWGSYYGGYGYGWGGGALAGYSADINHTLAVGVGDEGVVKNNIARVLATPAIPETASHAQKNLELATLRTTWSWRPCGPTSRRRSWPRWASPILPWA